MFAGLGTTVGSTCFLRIGRSEEKENMLDNPILPIFLLITYWLVDFVSD